MSDDSQQRTLGKRRGRPTNSGVQPSWMLARITIVLETFQRARAAGEKFEVAVALAEEAARNAFPRQKTSTTTIKNILSAWMKTEKDIETMLVTVTPEHTDLPNQQNTNCITYTLKVGERPKTPRTNRRDRSDEEKTDSESSND